MLMSPLYREEDWEEELLNQKPGSEKMPAFPPALPRISFFCPNFPARFHFFLNAW